MRVGFKWYGQNVSVEEMITFAREDPLFPYSEALIRWLAATSITSREGIHVSSLISPCHLRERLEREVDYWSYPQEVLGLAIGSLVHGILEQGDGLKELELSAPCEGTTIIGHIDHYDPERGVITDYKTARYVIPHKLPYGNHGMQVNVYAWLLRKNGYTPRMAVVRYIDMSGPSKCKACSLPLVDEGEMLECPECGGLYSKEECHTGVVPVPIRLWDEREADEKVGRMVADLMSALHGPEPAPKRVWLCNYCQFYRRCWK